MRQDWERLDQLGSFRTPSGIEGICWTHRGQGWDVGPIDGKHVFAANKTEAEAVARRAEDAAQRQRMAERSIAFAKQS